MLARYRFATNFDQIYELGSYLGEGSFGTVHVAIERATGQRFAVKTIRKKKLGSRLEHHFVKRVQHEVDMYRHLGRCARMISGCEAAPLRSHAHVYAATR